MIPSTTFVAICAIFLATSIALPSPADQALLSRTRRDACTDLLQMTGEKPYVTCFSYLSQIGPEDPNAQPTAVEDYCDANCNTTMNAFFDQVEVACGGGDQGGEAALYDSAIKAICHIDPRGYHCGVDYITLTNYTTLDVSYTKCVDSYFNGGKGGTCPSECAAATDYIIKTFGCCYTEIEKLEVGGGIAKYTIDSTVFKSCGKVEPEC